MPPAPPKRTRCDRRRGTRRAARADPQRTSRWAVTQPRPVAALRRLSRSAPDCLSIPARIPPKMHAVCLLLADGAHSPPPNPSTADDVLGLSATACAIWLFIRTLLRGSGPPRARPEELARRWPFRRASLSELSSFAATMSARWSLALCLLFGAACFGCGGENIGRRGVTPTARHPARLWTADAS